jgi:hypothetical protein
MHLMHPWRARRPRIFHVILVVGLLLFIFGCKLAPQGPTAGEQALAQIQQGPTAERNEIGLHRVNIPEGQGILYIKAPRPHLERFDRLTLDPVEIQPDGGDLPWNGAVTNRLRKSFARTLKKNLNQQKTWRLTDERGPGVLRMRVSARDLSVRMGLPHVSAGRNAPAQERNRTTLVMELFDSDSGEILVQFIQRRDLPAGVQTGSRVEIDRLRVYYSGFATSMGDSLGQLAQAVENVRIDDNREATR